MNRKISFLGKLPGPTRARLLDLSTSTRLLAGTILATTDTPTRFVYFPDTGVIALSPRLGAEYGPLVMLIGAESLVGAHVQLGLARSPLDATVTLAGDVHRISAPAYALLLRQEPVLDRLNRRATAALLRHSGLAAVCLRRHLLGARLVRLLLDLADHFRHDVFPITHASLAGLLGVRREGISLQAEDLQKAHLIAYRRGLVTIVDRAGLETLACACYAAAGAHATKRWHS